MSSIAKAKALADDWAFEAREAADTAALCSHFDGTSPHELIAMWTSGRNLEGKALSQFETRAIVERWCAVFGVFPPDDDDAEPSSTSEPGPSPELALPADDTMLRAKDVVRITGLSLATLKRMALNGRFAKPMRLSPRRIGWPARDVKAWLDTAEGARHKARR